MIRMIEKITVLYCLVRSYMSERRVGMGSWWPCDSINLWLLFAMLLVVESSAALASMDFSEHFLIEFKYFYNYRRT